MSSRASETAVDEKSIEETTVIHEEVGWKEPPDGGWKAWSVIFGSFCVSIHISIEMKKY